MRYDWDAITSLAYTTLIELDVHEFPIPVNKIKCKGVKICSYQHYAKLTGLTVEEITLGHELDDAFLIKGLRQGLTLILYNEESYDPRMKHTLWHEIGHVKCGHQVHGEKEEIEAHFFASQANAPNVLIRELSRRGYKVDIAALMKYFGLSEKVAEKKQDYLRRFNFEHTNQYDDIVLMQFYDFLQEKYPVINPYYYDEDFEEQDRKREQWY